MRSAEARGERGSGIAEVGTGRVRSPFALPRAREAIGYRSSVFGTVPGRRTVSLLRVKSGLRTDPEQWKDPRHRAGLEAERQAMTYLLAQGWTILAHRFRVGRTEVDLVVRKGSLVAFVEVKARRGEGFGAPVEAVTGAKQRELVRAARGWIDRYGTTPDVYRFDCIAILNGRLEHLEDAFRPGWR